MRPSVLRSLLLIALLATAVAGCSNSNSVTAPSNPVLTTETLTGTLSPAGTNYNTFVAKTGNVVMTMASISPDPTLKIGMQIGVFNGLSCSIVMDNPTATVGSKLVGLSTATTSMCVAIYDPGTVPAGTTVTYTVTVDHY